MMLWIKACHLIALISWFAGLFYLPRLYVYHSQTDDPAGDARFKVMEHKLYFYIMTPSAVLTALFGLWLLSFNITAYLSMGWMHAKLGLVTLLFGYHVACGVYLKQFATNQNQHTHVFYRWFNELPTLLLISIICLAVVKPF